MIGSLRRLAHSALAMARTRLELAGLELAQERDRLMQVALFGFLGVIALGVALLCGTAVLVIYFWDSSRLLAISLMTLLWLGLGVAALWQARSLLRAAATPLAQTLAELRQDLESIRASVKGGDS
jgi:uncharacterized membrane protein YqjE